MFIVSKWERINISSLMILVSTLEETSCFCLSSQALSIFNTFNILQWNPQSTLGYIWNWQSLEQNGCGLMKTVFYLNKSQTFWVIIDVLEKVSPATLFVKNYGMICIFHLLYDRKWSYVQDLEILQF